MKTLGFRVEPSTVHFAIVEGSADNAAVVTRDKFSAPSTYGDADQLVWYRERVRATLTNHKVDAVGIKFPEAGSKSAGTASAMKRLRIEGVILEATRSMSVEITAAGGIQHIKGRLHSDHSPKDYFTGGITLRGIKLSDFPKVSHEPILVAVAALGDAQ